MQAITQNRITQTAHGTSKAVDYSASPDPTIYAPEDGTIDSYMQRGSGTGDAGLALRMRGATGLHQFAHTERSLVSVGAKVKRGQAIAIMGYTGYTIPSGPAGRHVHWWIQRANGSYTYPPSLINQSFIKLTNSQGSSSMEKTTLHTARILSDSILGRVNSMAGTHDADLNKHHVGANLSNGYIGTLYNSNEAIASRNARATHKQFYETYASKIAELSARPTKAQLEQLGASLRDEQAKVVAAEKALEEAKKNSGGISAEDSAAIQETKSIVEVIKSILEKIFK